MLCVKSFQAFCFLQQAEVATSAKNIFSLFIMHIDCNVFIVIHKIVAMGRGQNLFY